MHLMSSCQLLQHRYGISSSSVSLCLSFTQSVGVYRNNDNKVSMEILRQHHSNAFIMEWSSQIEVNHHHSFLMNQHQLWFLQIHTTPLVAWITLPCSQYFTFMTLLGLLDWNINIVVDRVVGK